MNSHFCLVFTAQAKWSVELRAKIGQYRNRCLTVSATGLSQENKTQTTVTLLSLSVQLSTNVSSNIEFNWINWIHWISNIEETFVESWTDSDSNVIVVWVLFSWERPAAETLNLEQLNTIFTSFPLEYFNSLQNISIGTISQKEYLHTGIAKFF